MSTTRVLTPTTRRRGPDSNPGRPLLTRPNAFDARTTSGLEASGLPWDELLDRLHQWVGEDPALVVTVSRHLNDTERAKSWVFRMKDLSLMRPDREPR